VAILTGLIGGIAIIVHKVLRPWMYRFGETYWQARIRANRTIEMALRGVREVMLYRLQENFCDRLRPDLQTAGRAGALAQVLNDSPRQVIEFSAVATFMGFLGVEAAQGRPMSAILLVASVFAAAAFRLIPSISRLSSAAASISNIRPAFDLLKADLAISQRPPAPTHAHALRFNREIELRGIGFRYSGAVEPALMDVSARIPRCSSFAIVGRSGAGKSTMMELLLGLLEPGDGEILIDGLRLTPSNRLGWQTELGYVPQQTFVCDDTIAGNIAYGVPPTQIDMAMVERAADLAGLASFVQSETKDGYGTVVGDNGVMLSGGQRQRLAIARALYRQPKVLFFDEATSALDSITEVLVNESIARLKGHVTVIIVAHRISSVRHCDKILVLEKGRVLQCGDFDQLSREEGAFRRLLEATTEKRKPAGVMDSIEGL
jgi:ABC-type multidrug transport system fused ATPase/permease subunit